MNYAFASCEQTAGPIYESLVRPKREGRYRSAGHVPDRAARPGPGRDPGEQRETEGSTMNDQQRREEARRWGLSLLQYEKLHECGRPGLLTDGRCAYCDSGAAPPARMDDLNWRLKEAIESGALMLVPREEKAR